MVHLLYKIFSRVKSEGLSIPSKRNRSKNIIEEGSGMCHPIRINKDRIVKKTVTGTLLIMMLFLSGQIYANHAENIRYCQ